MAPRRGDDEVGPVEPDEIVVDEVGDRWRPSAPVEIGFVGAADDAADRRYGG